jgi:hypothetical protein
LRLNPQTSGGSATRATDDPNAIAAEADLLTADVYIYTGAGDFLSRTRLTAADFTESSTTPGLWETNVPITVTTGPKSFYVGVNLPTDDAATLDNETLASAKSIVQTLDDRNLISLTNGLPMFSDAAVVQTMNAAPAVNSITANVKRIVAKVTVEKDAAIVEEGADGTLGELIWTINNQNLKYYMMQNDAPLNVDPNWASTSYIATDFAPALLPTDYVAVDQGPVATIDLYHALYAVENTSEAKTMKELARVTVSATFRPDMLVTSYVAGSGTTIPQANPNATAGTFYSVTPGVGQPTQFFANEADATAYATDKGGATVSTYTDGVCYWNIFLNKAGTGEVRRGDFYKCNIKRISKPGQPTDQVTSPDAQPATDTSITVDVNVLDWNTPILDDYDLVP